MPPRRGHRVWSARCSRHLRSLRSIVRTSHFARCNAAATLGTRRRSNDVTRATIRCVVRHWRSVEQCRKCCDGHPVTATARDSADNRAALAQRTAATTNADVASGVASASTTLNVSWTIKNLHKCDSDRRSPGQSIARWRLAPGEGADEATRFRRRLSAVGHDAFVFHVHGGGRFRGVSQGDPLLSSRARLSTRVD